MRIANPARHRFRQHRQSFRQRTALGGERIARLAKRKEHRQHAPSQFRGGRCDRLRDRWSERRGGHHGAGDNLGSKFGVRAHLQAKVVQQIRGTL